MYLLERKKRTIKRTWCRYFFWLIYKGIWGSFTTKFVDQYIVGLKAKLLLRDLTILMVNEMLQMWNCYQKYASNRFEIISIPEQKSDNGKKIRSTTVRDLLLQGEIEKANGVVRLRLHYGWCCHGFGRGSKMLGFPTANIEVSNDTFL